MDAALIFTGVAVEAVDRRKDYGKQRLRALGRVRDDYFMVAYTWRTPARQIISAWSVDDEGNSSWRRKNDSDRAR